MMNVEVKSFFFEGVFYWWQNYGNVSFYVIVFDESCVFDFNFEVGY